MHFEFDPVKNQSNLEKHGITLEDAQALWNNEGVEVDLPAVNGQFRYGRLGPMKATDRIVWIAVFTFVAGPKIRLISARKATAKETEYYEQARKK